MQTKGVHGHNVIILIVDDDMAVRRAIASLLESTGFEAITFASAEECLNSGRIAEGACLILDLRMPGMNGFEMQRQLVASGERIPIIFISAHGDSGAPARALKAGASAFLSKPFDSEELLEAVQAAVRKS